MSANGVNRVDVARAQLEEGRYGLCYECGDEIAEVRLRVLPFAVRCNDCEDVREIETQRQRALAAAPRRIRSFSTICDARMTRTPLEHSRGHAFS